MKPSSVTASIVAPTSMRYETISTLPRSAATWSGVGPDGKTVSGSITLPRDAEAEFASCLCGAEDGKTPVGVVLGSSIPPWKGKMHKKIKKERGEQSPTNTNNKYVAFHKTPNRTGPPRRDIHTSQAGTVPIPIRGNRDVRAQQQQQQLRPDRRRPKDQPGSWAPHRPAGRTDGPGSGHHDKYMEPWSTGGREGVRALRVFGRAARVLTPPARPGRQ